MGIVLALLAAASWGLSDFLAGLASRRHPLLIVVVCVQVGGLLAIAVVALIVGPPALSLGHTLMALGAGLSAALGLALFYRALSVGAMGIVAPVSACGALVPVIAGLATGDPFGPLLAVGLAMTVIGVVLASRAPAEPAAAVATPRHAIGLALLAALGFGGFFVLIKAPSGQDTIATLLLVRAAPLPFTAIVLLAVRPAMPSGATLLRLVPIGAIDLVATGLIAAANRHGSLSVVSVLANVYPLITVALAAAILHERIRGAQLVGVSLALAGVGVVAVA
jgi:drug/metabolite transporter (DMT)-like permease